MTSYDCRYFYNSRQNHQSPEGLPGEWIDLAREPSEAHRLIKLGVSPRSDLPAMLVTGPGGKLRMAGLRLSTDEAVELSQGRAIKTDDLTMFSSDWCQDCQSAKSTLTSAGVTFREVNVDHDLEAEALVLARSGGRRVVPTLLFDRRLWAFHPEPELLDRLLASRRSMA